MDWFKKIAAWCWTHLGNFALIASWLVSAGFFPTLLALGEGATPVQYGIGVFAGVVVFWVIRALAERRRLWRAQRQVMERLSSDSSPFDPMAPSYEGKRLFLKDLVPPGRRFLENRKFTNCEIIGPGSIVVCLNAQDGTPPLFRGNIYHDVDCIQVEPDPQKASNNAIYFPGCDFDRCQFYNLNLLFYDRYDPSWHWITPIAAQTTLIEQRSENDGSQDH